MSGLSRALGAWRDAPPPGEVSMWVVGRSRASFEAAAPLLAAVAAAKGRVRIILSGPEADLGWLARTFPGCAVHAPPPPFGLGVHRFLRRANLRAVIALDDAAIEPVTLRGLEDGGLPIVAAVTGADAGPVRPEIADIAVGTVTLSDRAGLDLVVETIGEALARDHKLLRRSSRRRTTPAALLVAAARRPGGAGLVGWRFRRLGGADEVFEALGQPGTIMCLGNGPSSEDPVLATLPHDALFRVNRSWADRAHLTKPHVVFTANRSAMRAVEGAAFGIRTDASELRLAEARALRPGCGPTRFFRAEEVSAALTAYRWGAFRPTNGATMVACAVALRPKRLIVAGIDMFRHPDGAYPGDARTPNAFAPAHDPEAELDFLLSLFASYEGELTIVGEVLGEAWAALKGTA